MFRRSLLGVASVCALSLTPVDVAKRQASTSTSTAPASGWAQWGGPTRDFHATSTALADAWPASGPPVLWSRPLGTGHSAIVVDDGRLFTMYRAGNGRGRQGPWKNEEVVIALDAKTGTTIWEHQYAARTGFEDFSFGPGPHSTPLVAGERVFTAGTNQQLFAFDKRTGRVLWSHDFVKDFKSPELLIRPVVKVGYGCSPIAFRDTIICSVGGPGQSVMAFRQSNGEVVWKSGDFLTAGAAPILIQMGGRPQIVFFAGGTITGMDPANGAILWSHPHDPGNDLNCGTPIFGPDNVLFMSSAYQAGSRAVQLSQRSDLTDVDELWFTNRVRFMFLSSIRIGDFVYGTTGDFGPAFLTALNIKTGQSAWQVRGFARASLLHADGKVIIMNEDGDLALARLTPAGAEILSRTKIFDTTSWTAPTLAGTTLYARDREKIVALNLGTGRERGGQSGDRGVDRARQDGRPYPPLSTPAPPAVLSGSWKLDAAASTVTDGANFAGLVAKGAPPWLFVTQPINGTLIVESPINTGHTRFYRFGRSTTTEIADGTITMSAAWVGKAIVAEGRTTSSNGASVVVKETISRDGDALVVEIVSGANTSKLRYTRLTDVGPCESWPTPCKRSAPSGSPR
jgi:outer membrane protein assembly factor BamB